jgi:predicted nucleotidyltransferase
MPQSLISQSPNIYKAQPHTRTFRLFDDFLLSIQGLKPNEVSESKLNDIRKYLEENNLEITKGNIQQYLKKHKKYDWYNRLNNIYYMLTGETQPQLGGTLTLDLKISFCNLFTTFLKKTRSRKIFFESSYVVYKILQKRGYEELAQELIPFRKKYLTNDKLYKELCDELNWTFIETKPY